MRMPYTATTTASRDCYQNTASLTWLYGFYDIESMQATACRHQQDPRPGTVSILQLPRHAAPARGAAPRIGLRIIFAVPVLVYLSQLLVPSGTAASARTKQTSEHQSTNSYNTLKANVSYSEALVRHRQFMPCCSSVLHSTKSPPGVYSTSTLDISSAGQHFSP